MKEWAKKRQLKKVLKCWKLNSSLFINNQELRHINEKISILINQLDDYREERLADKLGEKLWEILKLSIKL